MNIWYFACPVGVILLVGLVLAFRKAAKIVSYALTAEFETEIMGDDPDG